MEIITLQGIYYVVTGLWSVFHIASFEKITGPKTDKWLVKAMGLMFASVGIVLIAGSSAEVYLLSVLIAVSILIIDAYYSSRRVISKVYLADGLIHAIILVALVIQYVSR